MKEVTAYQTADGTLYSERIDALAADLRDAYSEVILLGCDQMSVSTSMTILANADRFIEILRQASDMRWMQNPKVGDVGQYSGGSAGTGHPIGEDGKPLRGFK